MKNNEQKLSSRFYESEEMYICKLGRYCFVFSNSATLTRNPC